MKKKVLATLLVTAGIMNIAGVAFASEVKDTNVEGVKSESSIEIEKKEKKSKNDLVDDNMSQVSDVAIQQLDYAIEDMRIAIETLNNEGFTEENKEYIVRFGVASVDRIRPFHDEINGDEELRGHLNFIKQSWDRILDADKNFVGDGTAEDNFAQVSQTAIEELNYSIEEMRIAINKLNDEGLTEENKEYIVRFGSTSVERIKPFYDEIKGDKELKLHLDFIDQSWARILEAKNNFVGDGSAQDDFAQVSQTAIEQLNYAIEDMREAIQTLEKEGLTEKNKEYILTLAAYSVERIRPFHDEINNDKELSGHLDFIKESWNRILEADKNFVGDGSGEDNFLIPDNSTQVAPDEDTNNDIVVDGSGDDNFIHPGEVENKPEVDNGQVEDGSAEDKFEHPENIETPDQSKPEVDNGQVEDGNSNQDAKPENKPETTPEVNLEVKPELKPEVVQEVPNKDVNGNDNAQKVENNTVENATLPKTGDNGAVGLLATTAAVLGIARFSLRKK